MSVTLPGETVTVPDQSEASLSSRPKRTLTPISSSAAAIARDKPAAEQARAIAASLLEGFNRHYALFRDCDGDGWEQAAAFALPVLGKNSWDQLLPRTK